MEDTSPEEEDTSSDTMSLSALSDFGDMDTEVSANPLPIGVKERDADDEDDNDDSPRTKRIR